MPSPVPNIEPFPNPEPKNKVRSIEFSRANKFQTGTLKGGQIL